MSGIPRAPFFLGLAGLVPFIWGALTYLNGDLNDWGRQVLGSQFVGPYVQLFYGSLILSFMSGVLWGFATKTSGSKATTCYTLSVLPALWAFFMTGGGPVNAGTNLIYGFTGLLMLDAMFSYWRLTPVWWMRLRILLTAVVLACLAVGIYL
ncbi:Protein of unknown function [Ruegeria halocynthiae]|uniref:DUF3429 domain-containing protein n=1 Tax=Ruegeria halocynthiae TaxID=985054 RepID=A0A1H3CX97_9RHOB|nr:DUF3429 domain-containing protein [Ruegeria halocynthiae]SDX58154.1 Protein of unknown function [Ruegeria halocynthiae]